MTPKKKTETDEPRVGNSKALDTAISALKKRFGGEVVSWLNEVQNDPLDVISTGSLALDAALGVGGIVRGRLYELYGPHSSGKSTVAYSIIAEAQKRGLKSVYVDAERTLDKRLVAKMGARPEDIFLVQAYTAEDNLDAAETLVATGEVAVCVIDSISALQPTAEANLESFSKDTMGLQPRLISRMCRTFTPLAGRTKTALILINQIRANLGYGAAETTSGGNALQHHLTGKVRVSGSGSQARMLKNTEGEVIGHRVLFEVKKNKLAVPFRSGEVDLIYGVGFDTNGELLSLGTDMGFVEQSGSWFSMNGEKLGQGRFRAAAALAENDALRSYLHGEVSKVLGISRPVENEQAV